MVLGLAWRDGHASVLCLVDARRSAYGDDERIVEAAHDGVIVVLQLGRRVVNQVVLGYPHQNFDGDIVAQVGDIDEIPVVDFLRRSPVDAVDEEAHVGAVHLLAVLYDLRRNGHRVGISMVVGLAEVPYRINFRDEAWSLVQVLGRNRRIVERAVSGSLVHVTLAGLHSRERANPIIVLIVGKSALALDDVAVLRAGRSQSVGGRGGEAWRITEPVPALVECDGLILRVELVASDVERGRVGHVDAVHRGDAHILERAEYLVVLHHRIAVLVLHRAGLGQYRLEHALDGHLLRLDKERLPLPSLNQLHLLLEQVCGVELNRTGDGAVEGIAGHFDGHRGLYHRVDFAR